MFTNMVMIMISNNNEETRSVIQTQHHNRHKHRDRDISVSAGSVENVVCSTPSRGKALHGAYTKEASRSINAVYTSHIL